MADSTSASTSSLKREKSPKRGPAKRLRTQSSATNNVKAEIEVANKASGSSEDHNIPEISANISSSGLETERSQRSTKSTKSRRSTKSSSSTKSLLIRKSEEKSLKMNSENYKPTISSINIDHSEVIRPSTSGEREPNIENNRLHTNLKGDLEPSIKIRLRKMSDVIDTKPSIRRSSRIKSLGTHCFSNKIHTSPTAGTSGLNGSIHKYPLRSLGRLPDPIVKKSSDTKKIALRATTRKYKKREEPEPTRVLRSSAVLRRSNRIRKRTNKNC